MFTSAIKTIGSRSGIGRRIEAQTEHVVYGSPVSYTHLTLPTILRV